MIFTVSESAAKAVVSMADAIEVVEAAFISLDEGQSIQFPPTSGHGSDRGTRFGAKAGYDALNRTPGLKVGTYWPENRARGLVAHGSTTLLLDDATGQLAALVSATYLNSLRTAAAEAVAVRCLARPDASVLAIVGAGHQAYWEAMAVREVRDLTDVRIADREPRQAEALASRLREAGLPARAAATIEAALDGADLVTTITAARGPLFDHALVRPGMHVSAMGADGPGKQELDPALAVRARLFADLPDQSVRLGEFQYVAAEPQRITAIGAVASGRAPGRQSATDITVFDSSGVALQDLVIAALALRRACEAGLATPLDLS